VTAKYHFALRSILLAWQVLLTKSIVHLAGQWPRNTISRYARYCLPGRQEMQVPNLEMQVPGTYKSFVLKGFEPALRFAGSKDSYNNLVPRQTSK
jgi:hypothetical protein